MAGVAGVLAIMIGPIFRSLFTKSKSSSRGQFRNPFREKNTSDRRARHVRLLGGVPIATLWLSMLRDVVRGESVVECEFPRALEYHSSWSYLQGPKRDYLFVFSDNKAMATLRSETGAGADIRL